MAGLRAIKGWLRHFIRGDAGGLSVEFALTLPIYMGLIIFLVEVARIVYTQGVILHAAEEATRFALVNYDATTAEVQARAEASLLGLNPDNLTAILVTAPVDPSDQTKLVTVEVQYQYVPILPVDFFVGAGAGEGFALTGQSSGFITEEIPAG